MPVTNFHSRYFSAFQTRLLQCLLAGKVGKRIRQKMNTNEKKRDIEMKSALLKIAKASRQSLQTLSPQIVCGVVDAASVTAMRRRLQLVG